MMRIEKRSIIAILACLVLLAGYIFGIQKETKKDGGIKSYCVVFENSKQRVALDIYGTKFFYMETENTTVNFYLYDFSDGKIEKVETVSKFALKGRSNARIGNILYFYLSIYDGDDLENVLYAMDYKKKEMQMICKNSYVKKLIPLIEMNGELLALQGDVLNNGDVKSFIELVNVDGSVQQLTLQQEKIDLDSSDFWHIIYFDGNGQCLYSIESITLDSEVKYYFAVYNQNFICTKAIEVTDIIKSYGIYDNIGVFYAFGDFFCITDYSGNTIVCQEQDGKENVILYGKNLEYAVNLYKNFDYKFFYVRNTNDVYRLNTKSGELEVQNYSLDNDVSVIRYALSGGKNLLVVKK